MLPDSFMLNSSIDGIKQHGGNEKEEIQIKVENFDNDTVHLWSIKKFYDKLEMIKDVTS